MNHLLTNKQLRPSYLTHDLGGPTVSTVWAVGAGAEEVRGSIGNRTHLGNKFSKFGFGLGVLSPRSELRCSDIHRWYVIITAACKITRNIT